MFRVAIEGYEGIYTVNSILENGKAYLVIIEGYWKIINKEYCKIVHLK